MALPRRFLTIAVKLALLITLLVTALVLIIGAILVREAEGTMNERIDHEGARLASTLAESIDRILFIPPGGMDLGRWEFEKQQTRRSWHTRFERIAREAGADEILDLSVIRPSGELEIGIGAAAVELPGAVETAAGSDIRVLRGRHTGGGVDEPVRQFRCPVKEGGTVHAEARVTFYERKIEQARQAVVQKLTWIAGIGLVIAVALAVLFATLLTRPIRQLAEDMRVVQTGDLTYKSEVRTRDEVGVLAATFNEMTSRLKVAQQKEVAAQVVAHDLEIAARIQTSLLPQKIPQYPGIDLFASYVSAKEVSGDYYDFIPLSDRLVGMVVADVSGKGVAAALVMTMMRSLFRVASHTQPSPRALLRSVNAELHGQLQRGIFVTAVYLVLDTVSRRLSIGSAGHNPVVLWEAAAGDCRTVPVPGVPLGAVDEKRFNTAVQETTLSLAPGDRVVVYTDGVVEAMNPRNEEFEMKRLLEHTRRNHAAASRDYTERLLAALAAHRGRAEQSDDITLLTFRVTA